jgi:protein O-GlcNAc transferase
MSAYKLAPTRRATLAAVIIILIIFLFLKSNPYRPFSRIDDVGQSAPPVSKQVPGDSLSFPADYTPASDEPSFCAERFGLLYLENLRDSATRYCKEQSGSHLTCFHSKTASDRIDTFCLGQNAIFDRTSRKFVLQCELGEPSVSKSSFRSPKFNHFHGYWYETGPKVIFRDWVGLGANSLPVGPSEPRVFTILVKREMGHNLWHTLMEIFSMTMSIDVLRITPQAGNSLEKRSFLSDAELANIQVILLDDIEDGPFLDLWSLLSNKPPVRVKDLPNDSYLQNIVVPLPGGSNPFWQGDWSIHSCEDSALLRTFSRRVLSFYGLSSPQPRRGSQLVLTFIDRTSTRRLVNKETFLAELKSKYPRVTVQNYDFAAIPLKQQLKIIQNTDILVGVHGAGLTHGFFLSPRSAVVEILPPKLNHKGFRNVASLMDLGYFSAHGDETPRVKRGWQEEDVYIDNERFMTLMDAAIKSMYNKGERNYDII